MSKSNNRNSAGSSRPLKDARIAVLIMAAGKGTRLKSRLPKVLHEVGGKPLLQHVVAAASGVVHASHIFAVIGHEAEQVRTALASTGINFVLQAEQRGTGHALMVAESALAGYDHVLVLSGDAPLIRRETVEKLRDFHLGQHAAMTLLTAVLNVPRGYGRILRKGRGPEVQAIVEEKALTEKQRALKEVNAGFYAFAVKPLYQHIKKLGTDNAHREYYLTDMAAILSRAKQKVVAIPAENAHEVLGCNTRWELVEVDSELRLRKCRQLMEEGVTIYRPETCVIDSDVQVGPDTVIEPDVQLLGATRIGRDCRIQSHSVVSNCELGDGVLIRPGVIMDQSRVANGAVLGPYTHLRPGCQIEEGAHMGNFVEGKKLRLGKGSKAQHLTYLGDTEVGEKVNVGAGTITCNYDGFAKHKTIIEDGAFVGSDSTLVAPVTVGKRSYIGAASCITENVPDDALAIGRGRQINKEGWAKEKRQTLSAAKAKSSGHS